MARRTTCASERALMAPVSPSAGSEVGGRIPPGEPGVDSEANLAGPPCGVEGRSEALVEAGAGEGVGVAAFGEETVPSAGENDEAVHEPVGQLDGVELGS